MEGSLWKDRDFTRFWVGQTIGQFGNQVTLYAFPTIAILILRVNVFQVGILGAIEFLPYPLLGLFVGVWVDRFRRKPIMIVCNVGRLVTLSYLPIAFLTNSLNLYVIYAVAGVNGVFTIFFEIASQSYLPIIVKKEDLVDGNSKLQTSVSAANLVGPTFAGVLIEAVGAATAVLADVFGYFISSLALISIRKDEAPPRGEVGTDGRKPFISDLKEGVRLTFRVPALETLTGATAMANFGTSMAQAVYLYFAYNQLGLTPFLVGLVGTAGGLGFLFAAFIARRLSDRLGPGRALTLSLMTQFGWAGFPLALVFPAVPTLMVFTFLSWSGGLVFNIIAVTMIQRGTPNRLLGRMSATRRTISRGVIPVAAFAGGILGTVFGLSATIAIGGLVTSSSFLWIGLGPLGKLKSDDDFGKLLASHLSE